MSKMMQANMLWTKLVDFRAVLCCLRAILDLLKVAVVIIIEILLIINKGFPGGASGK